MGFGIRVPGVRISTRGVRVGPRMANVRVSYKGRVSASAGPRIARVSVSGSGVRIGSGIGPLGASIGRGGIRVSGGAGPVFGSIGRGGVRGGIGLGPLWLSGGGSSRSNTRTNQSRSTGRIRMSDNYDAYKQDLITSGGTRRNRDELRIAGINAAFYEALPILAPLQTFEAPRITLPNQTDTQRWANNWARQVLSSQGRYKPTSIVVPPIPTKHELREQAIQRLADSGKRRPVHPLTQYGFPNENMPTRQAIHDWAEQQIKHQTKLGTRLFKSAQVKTEIEKLTDESVIKFQQEHSRWLQENTTYENEVARRMDTLSEILENKRETLQQLKDAEETEINSLAKIRREEQQEVHKILEAIFQLYQQGDPTITTIVLQAAFSDNEGSAAPVGIDQNDLLVIMTAPPESDVIWPESLNVGNYISAKKKTKTDRDAEYSIFLMAHTLATAKEAFAVASKLQRVKILVLDEKDSDKDPFKRPLLAKLEIDRNRAEQLPKGFQGIPALAGGFDFITKWEEVNQTGNAYAIVEWAEWFETAGFQIYLNFHLTGLDILREYSDCFDSWNDFPRSKRPKFIEFTESSANTTDDIQVAEDVALEDLEVLDLSVDEINTLDFWMLCALLADIWDEAQVDLSKLKTKASALVACLYPFEEDDIDWTLQNPIEYPIKS